MATHTTKTKILRRAEEALWSYGYEGASLSDVVDKAGVSKGAFFHYFPSKKAIAHEVVPAYAQRAILTPLEKNLSEATDLKSGLYNWLQENFRAFANGKFKRGCLLGNMALELSDKDEAVREQLKHIFLQWENQLVGYLRPAHEEGRLLMEPRQFARLIIAALQGITLTSKVHKDQIRASREFQALAEMIERMIKD